MTLNGVMAVILSYSTNSVALGPITSQLVEVIGYDYCLRQKFSPKSFQLIYGDSQSYWQKCVNERYPATWQSTCVTVRGHLSNSWALVFTQRAFDSTSYFATRSYVLGKLDDLLVKLNVDFLHVDMNTNFISFNVLVAVNDVCLLLRGCHLLKYLIPDCIQALG